MSETRQNERREVQVKYPLKIKFLVSMYLILIGALSLFFVFTERIFSDDKVVSVAELNLSNLRAIASEVKSEIRTRLIELQTFVPYVLGTPAYTGDPFSGQFSNLRKELLGISLWKVDTGGKATLEKTFRNEALSKERDLPSDLLDKLNSVHPLTLKEYTRAGAIAILNRSLKSTAMNRKTGLAALTFIVRGKKLEDGSGTLIIVADFLQDFLIDRMKYGDLSETFLISREGTVVSHGSRDLTIRFAAVVIRHPVVPMLGSTVLPRKSFEYSDEEDSYLCSVGEIGIPGIFAVSQTRKSLAFEALSVLRKKGAVLALICLALTLLFSILFAGHLTRHIRMLKDAAERIADGDLTVKMKIKTNDEIRSVSESFEWMAERLKELMADTAQKARMENELETARLVQSTILAPPDLVNPHVDIDFCYLPASEVGGDFWDVYRNGDTITIAIGDATGHGAPAAILSAMAKSCFSTLNAVYQGRTLTPEQFLMVANRIIHATCKGSLLMTMCIIQINMKTGELLVCSAGHESPLCLRNGQSLGVGPDGQAKWQAEVLSSRGERLGFSADSRYHSEHFPLHDGDSILLYTDGVSEAQGPDGKEWGQRSLKKAFCNSGPRPSQLIKQQILDAFEGHMSGNERQDDVTFVIAQYKRAVPAAGSNAPDPHTALPPAKSRNAA